MTLNDLDQNALEEFAAEIRSEYEELKAKSLKLNLTRGKPSAEQLDINNGLLSLPGENFYTKEGADARNYGNLKGVVDLREIWAELLGLPTELVYAGDSSSLNIMFDLISWSYIFGNNDSSRPWKDEEKVKWICPVPGYDRHFTITEHFDFEMITVPMRDDGPDMDAVRELARDPLVKGMWTVPIYNNPTGVTFSEEICRQLASMETGAPDFRIVWDAAYAVHALTEDFPPIYNVTKMANEAGNPNRFWFMSSTSKITFAGSGVAFFASSPENLSWYTDHAAVRGIGPNKVNQLAHAQHFGSVEGVYETMRQHAASVQPKFEAAQEILDNRLSGHGVATWTDPEGGYFISLDVVDGTAARVVELARNVGIALTDAGSSFPLHQDPNDRNIRLAPTLPPKEEVEIAMDGVATCVLLAAVEKLRA